MMYYVYLEVQDKLHKAEKFVVLWEHFERNMLLFNIKL